MKYTLVKNSKPSNIKSFVFIALLLSSLLLAACGDSAAPTTTPVPTPDPQTLAKQAAEKITQVNYLHFLVEIKQGEVPIVPGISFRRAEGDFAKPDSYKATLRVSVAIGQVEATTIAIGTDQFIQVKGLINNWQPLPAGVGFKAGELFDAKKGLAAIVIKARDLKVMGSATVDNTDCWYLKGIIPGIELESFTAGTLNNSEVDFEIWVGKTDGLLRQASLKQIAPDPTKAIQWLMNFSKFNEVVKVERPAGV